MARRAKVRLVDTGPDPRAHKKTEPALFDQRSVKPREELRFQRGYTPERLQAVREALPALGHPLSVRQFHDSVARSTVPIKPIGEQILGGGVHLEEGAPPKAGMMGLTATPVRPNGFISETVPGSKVQLWPKESARMAEFKKVHPEEVMGTTAIHELGHVHQAATQPRDMAYRSPGSRERYADQFMIKHFRSDPRSLRKGTGLDAQDVTYPLTTSNRLPGYRGWQQERLAAVRRMSVITPLQRPSGWAGNPHQGQLF